MILIPINGSEVKIHLQNHKSCSLYRNDIDTIRVVFVKFEQLIEADIYFFLLAAGKDDRCFRASAIRELYYLIPLLSIGKKINWMSKELATLTIMLSRAWLILIIELSKINDLQRSSIGSHLLRFILKEKASKRRQRDYLPWIDLRVIRLDRKSIQGRCMQLMFRKF